MSERKLPEELLHNILNMHFARIPEAFCGDSQEDNAVGSVLLIPVYPISEALLVSKRWLRIGTPLLYKFLSLGRIEHVQAVAEVFRANPGLGKAVRHVRLRGGYGKELRDVLRQTPNAKHISVSLKVKAKDSVVGLVRSIPLLDPTALYLHQAFEKRRQNKKQLEILHSLESAMADAWSSLRFLYFWRFSKLPSTLCVAICRSPSLKEISIHGLSSGEWLWRGWLKALSELSNIARVLYRGKFPDKEWFQELGEAVAPSDVMKLLAQAEDIPAEDWADQPMHVPGVCLSLPVSWVEQRSTQY